MFWDIISYMHAVDSDGLEKAVQAFLKLFNGAIDNLSRVDGKRRPGKLAKHEHFGFRDGISQPAMRYDAVR